MGSLVDDMLQLARLDQHPARHSEPVDLTALAGGCLQRAQIADRARTWQASIAAGLVVTGDEELLRQAIDNLLANVTAHTPAATTATLTATRADDAIAAAAAGTAHDGTAQAALNDPDGLRITLTFPVLPNARQSHAEDLTGR